MTANAFHFKCSNLNLSFGGKILCSQLNLDFHGPGFVLIEGENGTGKSTLLKAFAGFIVRDGARISFNDRSPESLGPGQFSFLTTTSLGLLDDLTGREHIELLAASMKLDRDQVDNHIQIFSQHKLFQEILKTKSQDCSQGMKQLLRVFLHLFSEPSLLFLDEPFLYLSPSLKQFVAQRLEERAKQAIVFITDQKFSWSPETRSQFIRLGGE